MALSPPQTIHWSGSFRSATSRRRAIRVSSVTSAPSRWARPLTSGCCVMSWARGPRGPNRGRTRSRPGCSAPAGSRHCPARTFASYRGDVRPVHEAMVKEAGGKNVWIVGGGELAGRFYDHGLLDELFVQIGSVTLGAGKPLLPRAITSPPFRLISARAVGTGFAELHYEVPRPQST